MLQENAQSVGSIPILRKKGESVSQTLAMPHSSNSFRLMEHVKSVPNTHTQTKLGKLVRLIPAQKTKF
jgi:hypothetical protein